MKFPQKIFFVCANDYVARGRPRVANPWSKAIKNGMVMQTARAIQERSITAINDAQEQEVGGY